MNPTNSTLKPATRIDAKDDFREPGDPGLNSPLPAQSARIASDPLQTTTNCYKFQNEKRGQSTQVDTQDSTEELSPPQRSAIELLVQGKVDRVVAEHLGVHRVTVTKWRLYHTAFRGELSRRREEVWGTAADRFRGMLDTALDALARDLKDNYAPTRFHAAKAMLSMAHKFRPEPSPVDSIGVLEQHARVLKRSMRSTDPMIEPVDEEDLADARRDLNRRMGAGNDQ